MQEQVGAPQFSVLQLLFGLNAPVTRKPYIVAGVTLMALKYVLDAAAVYFITGQFYSPLRFFSPLISQRIPDAPATFEAIVSTDTALLIMSLWALVFMWIGLSMTVRRAVDAGQNGWLGVLFLVPVLNLVAMALFALLPSSDKGQWQPVATSAYRQGGTQPTVDQNLPSSLKSAMLGVVAAVLTGMAMVGIGIYGLEVYGTVLFFFTPFIMGAASAYIFNMHGARPLGSTLLVSLGSVFLTGLVMMLFALEGFICIAMATPIAAGIAGCGALIGRTLALQKGATVQHAAFAILALPALASAEARLHDPPVYEVVSVIEIDAPPENVWPNVIGFSELPQPKRALFSTGVAYPVRARIEGSGVGAVRHCEFSTGPFVEPITRWEPNKRLSFDVAAQPPAMEEWSPWANVYPPHLDASIRSRRGEFRLVALPGGRTRLEGSTWYELTMAPNDYWRYWSDLMIHSIHDRVLNHVRELSER